MSVFILVFVLSPSLATATPDVIASESLRSTLSLDGQWQVVGPGLDQQITIPGAIPWQAAVTTWSRSFPLNLQQSPTVAYLHYDGIVGAGIIRLNGQEVGRTNAFTHGRIDVGSALVANGNNTLEIELDDRLQLDTVPGGYIDNLLELFGDSAYTIPIAWEQPPGIVRGISLVYSDEAVIENVFATPELSEDLTTAEMRIRVVTKGQPATNMVATVALVRDDGQLVDFVLAESVSNTELEVDISVDLPRLWSPDDPVLYDLFVGLWNPGGKIDAVKDRIGFRKIEIRGSEFYLNNQPLFLRGVTRHDLYGAQGHVLDEEFMELDLQRLKWSGVNFVRTIHYPPDEKFVRRAEELGILLSEEIPAWANVTNETVVLKALDMLTKMVERDYNRAAVITWLTGTSSTHPGDALVQAQTYFPFARNAIRAIDAQRPISFVFDDNPTTPQAMLQGHLPVVRGTGMDYYAVVGYWDEATVASMVPVLPNDMPALIAEWTGSEGSNHDPIGAGGSVTFPAVPYPDASGWLSESFQVTETYRAIIPFLAELADTSADRPFAGLIYYNWQDLRWPGIRIFYPGHFETVRNGLIYETGTPKASLYHFKEMMSLLPR